jgi:hypothetical protein
LDGIAIPTQAKLDDFLVGFRRLPNPGFQGFRLLAAQPRAKAGDRGYWPVLKLPLLFPS